MNIIFSSCGNDSVALIQWAFENKLEDIHVAYSDTQWAADWWPERVEKVKAWVKECGGTFHTIESKGFQNLVREKAMFPCNGRSFCSYELKIKPAMDWLEQIDPEKQALVYTGVMRCESEARKNWPEVKEDSPNHGGRTLISPMATWTVEQRDEMLAKTPFEKLSHRSAECWPCVNANKRDIQMLEPERVRFIADFEKEMGVGKRSGKPKYLFRSSKHEGAQGMQQVYERACSGAKDWHPDQDDLFGCDSGFCGG